MDKCNYYKHLQLRYINFNTVSIVLQFSHSYINFHNIWYNLKSYKLYGEYKMSENELEQILNDIKNRTTSNEQEKPNNEDNFEFSLDIETPKDIDTLSEEIKETNFDIVFEDEAKEKENSDDDGYFDLDAFSRTSNRDNKDDDNEDEEKPKDKKKIIIISIAVALIVALVVGIACAIACHKKPEDTPVETTKKEKITQAVKDEILNPLTGEAGFSAEALKTRPVAVVVENEYSTEAVRPQWALNDADIVLEGESEFSTRLLLFWADYTKVPEMVGPTRSARPPFIKFSQLFDCVFIHAGLSSSKGNYIGADAVFENYDVDHINLLRCTEDGTYFGRNNDRYTAVEHTGYLNGKNLPQLIKDKGISMDIDTAKFSTLSFNKKVQPLSENSANTCEFVWSSTGISACPKHAKFSYDETNHKYTTTDFDSSYGEANLAFENLIFLFDETDYVVKENYKGSGNSEIYCNYRLAGGKGTILSEGTALEITWSVDDGKLTLKTEDGKDAKLNAGKSYIGYGSSNHGGSLTLNPVA